MPTSPICAGERLQGVDVLRGFAILGILLVNMLMYGFSYAQVGGNHWTNPWDAAAETLILTFASGKFIVMLAFLFGFGMIVMKERAEQREGGFFALYARRLLALAAFGALHAFLIWFGDILLHYAVLGAVMLLFFANREARTLKMWGFVMLGLTGVLLILMLLLLGALGTLDPAGYEEAMHGDEQGMHRLVWMYGSGTWSDLMEARMMEWKSAFASGMLYWPQLLAMMLLGAYAAKRRILHDVEEHKRFLKKLWGWSLALGLPLSLLPAVLEYGMHVRAAYVGMADLASSMAGAPLLSAFYGISLLLLLRSNCWKKRFKPLAKVGRMAFSVYILQSLIATTLFYSYGFGLYGKIGPALGLLITFAIWAVLVPFSIWWLKKFRFGPLEYVWRTATYLKRP